ncbi:hypothetical protein PhCBS80983_g04099 [Powellomyces hirtus]|uniref:Actin-related protein 8 n=1 Tax=Powellomyces hirtus TaxID=109895 RepID=A0A507E083_9FUNG|nr:hypothetical protein PhCBS80983_g04099 [Powellomyces hirtus]
MHALPLAGDSISQRLKVLIKVYGNLLQEGAEEGVPVPDTFINTLTCENWEEMKAQMCFVGERPSTTNAPSETIHQDRRLRAYESSAPQMTWTTNGCDRLVMPGWVRERAAEILFEGDDDMRSVATIVADTLLKCPTDIRTELAQSILLIGGTCMLPGFSQRLLQEIRATLEEAKTYQSIRKLAEMIQCRKSVFAPNCAAWIGGSLIGALKITGEDISRTAFMKSPILPDWAVIQSEPSIVR